MRNIVGFEMFPGTSGTANSERYIHGDYVPENFIKDEVYAILAAFEKDPLQRASVTQENHTMDTAMEEAYVDFEPRRLLTDSAPPKRFYRTFWRSAARRLLKYEHTTGITAIRQRVV
jgi:hypothetical protein